MGNLWKDRAPTVDIPEGRHITVQLHFKVTIDFGNFITRVGAYTKLLLKKVIHSMQDWYLREFTGRLHSAV